MGVRHIQDCDNCERERRLLTGQSPDLGGWIELQSGETKVWVCPPCLQGIVRRIADKRELRNAND